MTAQSLIFIFTPIITFTFYYCVYCKWSYFKIVQNKTALSHNRTVAFISIYKFIIVVDARVPSY